MKLSDILSRKHITLTLNGDSKDEIINNLIEMISNSDKVIDKEQYKKDVFLRESQSTTGIGDGIAIPHAKSSGIKEPLIGIGIAKNGLEFDSLDSQKAKIFFILGVPNSSNNEHIEIISGISKLLMDEQVKSELLKATSVDDVFEALDKGKEETKNTEKEEKFPRVLCVTACPTGIAHTFMAADALSKAGKEMGISIKVETNGADGAQNKLTSEQIKKCEGIIVASDKNVEVNRFVGKKVLFTKVADGIHKPKELINKVLNSNVEVFEGDNLSSSDDSNNSDMSLGRKFYKHLMSGVSNMLPFVVSGGILIALAFLFDDYSINPQNFGSNTAVSAFLHQIGSMAFSFMLPILSCFIAYSMVDKPGLVVGFIGGALSNVGGSGFLGALVAGFLSGFIVIVLKKVLQVLPRQLDGVKNILLYPLLGVFLIGFLMTFLVNSPVAFLNNAVIEFLNSLGSTSKVILGLILGGMMAIDMGGPINKAAYVFGVAAIDSQQFEIMAAVMAGGMVPPLAIAFATTFFKKKFSKDQRQAGITNYILGLSFITEGAIPFAAANPIRVIPSLVVASSISGALSMLFGSTLRAPHGGIFVTPVVGNPFMYIVSIFTGAIVGALLLGLLLQDYKEK